MQCLCMYDASNWDRTIGAENVWDSTERGILIRLILAYRGGVSKIFRLPSLLTWLFGLDIFNKNRIYTTMVFHMRPSVGVALLGNAMPRVEPVLNTTCDSYFVHTGARASLIPLNYFFTNFQCQETSNFNYLKKNIYRINIGLSTNISLQICCRIRFWVIKTIFYTFSMWLNFNFWYCLKTFVETKLVWQNTNTILQNFLL